MLGAWPSTRSHVVIGEDLLQVLSGSDGVRGETRQLAHRNWREHDGKIICHDADISLVGMHSSGISLHPLCGVHPSFVGLDPDDFETRGHKSVWSALVKALGPSGSSPS